MAKENIMQSNDDLLFIFIDKKLLVTSNHNLAHIESGLVKLTLEDLPSLPHELMHELGSITSLSKTYNSRVHKVLDLHYVEFENDGYSLFNLRELLALMPPQDFQHVAQAWQYSLFLRTHRYCGRCGEKMRQVSWEMAMHCDKCGHRVYPRVSPCIIVAIHNNKQILLAQGARQKPLGFYSILAGFVESGESLEQTLHREVMEEVGVSVKNIEYFGSQPWPFPHSLMVGFIAEYDSGDIVVDGNEIIEANWYEPDELPNIPPKLSIAGRLIEETLQRIKKNDAK